MTAKWLLLCKETWLHYETFSEHNKNNNMISVSIYQELFIALSLLHALSYLILKTT